jgi:hypothetical protein
MNKAIKGARREIGIDDKELGNLTVTSKAYDAGESGRGAGSRPV